ncbi:arginine--tRNA ligase, chloroplastic/mitochondrial [Tanacetum coccineum]
MPPLGPCYQGRCPRTPVTRGFAPNDNHNIALQLNAALQNSFRPYLKDELCVCKRLDDGRLKKYGDYLCSNILHICEILRSQDPNRFRHISPKTIAKEIMVNFVKSDMIRGFTLVDIGFLAFKINMELSHGHQCSTKVKKYFPDEQGTIRKKEELLFVIKEKASHNAHANYVHEDLASLWCEIYEQKADWIVYVAPLRQRDYIRKCFTAAKGYYEVEDFAADRDFKKHPTMSYLGYGTSGDEQAKLFRLWGAFQSYYKEACDSYVGEGMMMASGYSCLREEMCFTQGHNFLHLLDTRKKIYSVIEDSSSRDLFKLNKAFVGKEREFGLHLLQFTDAAEVVMEKGFDLLGITPKFSKGLTSYMRPQTGKSMAIRDHYISYPVSRQNPSSRFELFSMFISVAWNGFEMGKLFGSITVSDTCGLLSHGWCKVDAKGCGHVAHFIHDFDNSVGIRDTCFLPFGNPVSRHSVACSDSIKTPRRFFDGKESVKRNTFSTRGINGCVSIFYVLLKDDVDTSWSLWYEPEPTMVPKLHGHVVAYYGDDNDMSYEAVMLHIHPCKLEKGYQKLRRSTLAVPANETFKIRAFLQDDDSREVIVG